MAADSAFQDEKPPACYPIPSENSSFTSYKDLCPGSDISYHHSFSYPGASGMPDSSYYQQTVNIDLSSLNGLAEGLNSLQIEDPLQEPEHAELATNSLDNTQWLNVQETADPGSLSPYSNVSSGPDIEVVQQNFTECPTHLPNNPFEEEEQDEPNVSDYEDR